MAGSSSLFARKMIAHAPVETDEAELLRLVGIDPDADPDPKQFVTEDAYCTLLEKMAAASSLPLDFHIRTGDSMRCEDFGVLGLAWKSAPNLGDAFERVTRRYVTLVNRVSTFEVLYEKERTLLTSRRAGERLGAWLSNEAGLCTFLSICREAAGDDIRPIEVHFRHASLPSAPALEAHFGCPIHYGHEIDALVFEPGVMRRPNRLGDEGMHSYFQQHVETEYASLGIDAPLDERVRVEITRCLHDGVPAVSSIATRLGTSPRTLQRRLSERNISYQSLVDEARRRLAERLLRQTDHPLAEIAFLTGFSEQSGFTRAFKRWSGRTPRSFRLQPQGTRAGPP